MKAPEPSLWRNELAAYTLVCIICFSVDFLLLITLTELCKLHYLISGLIGFIVGNIANYLLSTKYVFKKRRFNARKILEFQLFMALGISSLIVHHSSFWLFTEVTGLIYTASKLIATACSFLWTFLVRRYFLFS
jgi:putative flippase GtrA